MGFLTHGIVHTIGQAIYGAVSQVASWAFGGLTKALLSTTSVGFSGWFEGPWRAMAAVSAVAAIPILVVGVASTVMAGRHGEAAKRALLAPVAISVGLVSARTLVAGLLALVGYMSAAVVSLGIGGTAGFGRALANLGVTLGLGAGVLGGARMPLAVSIVLVAVVGLLSFVIWVELALRAALLYLLVAFVPLGLAGLFWSWSSSWMRRLAELILAVATAQLVITVAMVLAAAALGGTGGASGVAAGVDTAASGVALLFLGSLGLPLALRVVPHAAEAAIAAGAGARAARRAGQASRQGGDALAHTGATPQTRLAGAVLAGRLPAAASAVTAMRRFPAAADSGTTGTPSSGGQAATAPRPRATEQPTTNGSTGSASRG